MQIEFKFPGPVEGAWQLLDAAGNPVNCPIEQLTLVIEPFFYKGSTTQLVMRAAVVGKKGREARYDLRVGSKTGKLIAETVAGLPAKIAPKFDALSKESK